MNPLNRFCSVWTAILFSCLFLLIGCPQKAEDPGALVLVNTGSPGYADFHARIVPYLETFGIPYTVLDVAEEDVTSAVEAFAVILVGHRGMDPEGELLGAEENEAISAAVRNGTGLVNFGNDLADPEGTGRYPFVQDLFGFVYGESEAGFGVNFRPGSVTLPCWDDDVQEPDLVTTTDASALIGTDGAWTEFLYESGGRPFPSIFGGVDEEEHGLPVMRYAVDGLASGTYEIFATLYRSVASQGLRYYYGFSGETPKSHYVDAVGGAVGPRMCTTRYTCPWTMP